MPKRFTDQSMTPRKAIGLLRALAGGELSLARLKSLKKSMDPPARPWMGKRRRGEPWPSTS
jgi:hypothetical protein